MFYYDYQSLIILLPLFIFSFIIQGKLNSTYSKYSKIINSKNITGEQFSRLILQSAGITNVSIECISGKLSDHFDPTKNTIRLSNDIYNGTSIASIGIAAHETGHAIQYAVGYAPIKIRSAILGLTNFSSKLLYFLLILSLFMNIPVLCDIAVLCFFVIFLFQLITLPVEFNASKRAIEAVSNSGYTNEDINGVKKVLGAAAMTYVAAMLISLGQMISYFLRTRNRR